MEPAFSSKDSRSLILYESSSWLSGAYFAFRGVVRYAPGYAAAVESSTDGVRGGWKEGKRWRSFELILCIAGEAASIYVSREAWGTEDREIA